MNAFSYLSLLYYHTVSPEPTINPKANGEKQRLVIVACQLKGQKLFPSIIDGLGLAGVLAVSISGMACCDWSSFSDGCQKNEIS